MFDVDTTRREIKVNSKMVRQFSVTLLLLTGALVWRTNAARFEWAWFISFSVISSVCLGIIGLLFPNRLRLLLTVVIALTHPIGSIVSFLVLGALFYLVFTPLGLVMRMLGRDKLSLGRRSDVNTYWKDHTEKDSKASYFRQS